MGSLKKDLKAGKCVVARALVGSWFLDGWYVFLGGCGGILGDVA